MILGLHPCKICMGMFSVVKIAGSLQHRLNTIQLYISGIFFFFLLALLKVSLFLGKRLWEDREKEDNVLYFLKINF